MTDISKWTAEEKARLISGASMWHLRDVPSLDLKRVMVTDGPHGLRKQVSGSGIAGVPATCFPTAVGLAASWDTELLSEVGQAIARECLAEDVAVLLGPGLNVKRHSLCGRNFEYFSEDPYLSGKLAAAFINGVQSQGVGTSPKHYAANNQEANRMVLDTIVDERTLREIYLAGFEIAVRESQPWTIMCAYNLINGTYCSDNEWLLTEVLRDEWGYEGIVVTDWGATHDRVAGVRAGLDLEMPGSSGLNDELVVRAVNDGLLPEPALDAIAARMLDLITRGNDTLSGDHTVDLDANHELACRAAAASQVLLTNDGLLPLESGDSVAVIGDFAKNPRFQGAGSSLVEPTRVDNLYDAITQAVSDPALVSYAAGYDNPGNDIRHDLIEEAVEVARTADVAVVAVGLPTSFEAEGFDRSHMRIPDQHNLLVQAVVSANPNTVVVLSNGSPVQMPWLGGPRAILEGYLGGQGSGTGTARVLFGEVNPSGKLAETFPLRRSDHGADADFGQAARQVQYREGVFVGYRWFDTVGVDVQFPFGHGLSYTSFKYDALAIDGSVNADQSDFGVDVSVQITNTGECAGAEVVQVYVRDEESSVARPDRELKGFARVALEPGASETVTVHLDRRAFAFWGGDGWTVENGDFTILVGSSSRDIRTGSTISIQSNHQSSGTPAAPSFEALDDQAAFEAAIGRPVPAPTPARPFNRNSTISEVSVNPLGVGLRKTMELGLQRQFGIGNKIDEQTQAVIDAVLDGLPLRGVVMLSEGKLTWSALDKLIAALNRMPATTGLLGRIKDRKNS